MANTFPILIINARPAAGKSEIIDFLNHIPANERKERFHIHQFTVFDDFPILWSWFEEDAILENMGYPRLHTNGEGYFHEEYLWHLLVELLCLQYEKCLRDYTNYHNTHTAVIEFSRGSEHGGYRAAYQHLSPAILSKASILYIDVSYKESLRKNRVRYNPNRPDSILEHALDDTKMEKLYRDDDWHQLVHTDKNYLLIKGIKIPYAIFPNEDDVTTDRGPSLEVRLERILGQLWLTYTELHQEGQFASKNAAS